MERCSASANTSIGLMSCPRPSVGEWTYGHDKFPLCEVHMRLAMLEYEQRQLATLNMGLR